MYNYNSVLTMDIYKGTIDTEEDKLGCKLGSVGHLYTYILDEAYQK